MTTSATAKTSTNPFVTGMFWDRLWRASGIISVVLFVIAYVIYGYQPQVGASADELAAFYEGNRTGILIAAILSGNAVLFLLWFAAALKTALTEAAQDGWGAAATASSAAVGALLLVLVTIGAAIAYSGNAALASGLNDFSWACVVLSSFPRAMLIMSGSFGLWRAGLISNALFAAGVAAVVLVFLGGTTWLSGGFWAPDGAYSRFVTPIIGLVWVVVVSRILLTRIPAARAGW
jgi:hypothetical protein